MMLFMKYDNFFINFFIKAGTNVHNYRIFNVLYEKSTQTTRHFTNTRKT